MGTHEIEFDDGYYLDQSHRALKPRTANELMDPRGHAAAAGIPEVDQGDHFIYITYPVESKIE